LRAGARRPAAARRERPCLTVVHGKIRPNESAARGGASASTSGCCAASRDRRDPGRRAREIRRDRRDRDFRLRRPRHSRQGRADPRASRRGTAVADRVRRADHPSRGGAALPGNRPRGASPRLQGGILETPRAGRPAVSARAGLSRALRGAAAPRGHDVRRVEERRGPHGDRPWRAGRDRHAGRLPRRVPRSRDLEVRVGCPSPRRRPTLLLPHVPAAAAPALELRDPRRRSSVPGRMPEDLQGNGARLHSAGCEEHQGPVLCRPMRGAVRRFQSLDGNPIEAGRRSRRDAGVRPVARRTRRLDGRARSPARAHGDVRGSRREDDRHRRSGRAARGAILDRGARDSRTPPAADTDADCFRPCRS